MARNIGKTGNPDLDLVLNRIQLALRDVDYGDPVVVTGNMTSPTLSELTAVVQSLLDGLASKGRVDDQTT